MHKDLLSRALMTAGVVFALGAGSTLTLAAGADGGASTSDDHGPAVSATLRTHGDTISDLARMTTATGEAKGDEVSLAASANKPASTTAATDVDGASTREADDARTNERSEPSSNAAFGQRVAMLAHTTTATGEEKGDAISSFATTHSPVAARRHR